MKTQIIQLQRNDDYISVRDKVDWCQTGRILLVWPEHGHVLVRQLDLNLINRQAASMGAELALVTRDGEVRANAEQIGIPVFSDTIQAQNEQWKTERKEKIAPRQFSRYQEVDEWHMKLHRQPPSLLEHPAIRIISLTASVLALFALVIFLMPGAKISLAPQVKQQTMRFEITADPALKAINLTTGSLPAYLQKVEVEGKDAITTTGSINFPDKFAIGDLLFTNVSEQENSIPAGTIVSTSSENPIRFITTGADYIIVPSDESVVIPARAIKPGASGNLPPDELVVIEGDLGMVLTVTNPDAMEGGSNTAVESPTEQDLQKLSERVRNKLMQSALAEINSIMPDGDTLISPTLVITETLVESSFPAVGDPGRELELSLRLTVQAYAVSKESMSSYLSPIMDANTPTGYTPLADTLTVRQISPQTFDDVGKAHWTIVASRELQVVIPAQQAISSIKGVTVEQAASRLSALLPLAEKPLITLSPSWWPRIPFMPMRIELTFAGRP